MRHLEEDLLNKKRALEQQRKDICDNKLKELLEKNEKFWKNDDDVSAKKSLFSSEIKSYNLNLLKAYSDLMIEKFPDARLILEVK